MEDKNSETIKRTFRLMASRFYGRIPINRKLMLVEDWYDDICLKGSFNNICYAQWCLFYGIEPADLSVNEDSDSASKILRHIRETPFLRSLANAHSAYECINEASNINDDSNVGIVASLKELIGKECFLPTKEYERIVLSFLFQKIRYKKTENTHKKWKVVCDKISREFGEDEFFKFLNKAFSHIYSGEEQIVAAIKDICSEINVQRHWVEVYRILSNIAVYRDRIARLNKEKGRNPLGGSREVDIMKYTIEDIENLTGKVKLYQSVKKARADKSIYPNVQKRFAELLLQHGVVIEV